MGKDDAFLKRLLATFKIEAIEHVAAISSGLLGLEKSRGPAECSVLVETIFREIHSLKGAARAVNASPIETVCRSMESIFSILKKNGMEVTHELLDLLHRCLEVIRLLLDSLDGGGLAPDRTIVRELTSRLDRTADDLEKGSQSESAPPAGVPSVPEAVGESLSAQTSTPAPLSAPVSTIRVEKTKLDGLMLRTEGLLQAKQHAGERAREAREIATGLGILEKQWAAARRDMRAIGRLLKQERTPPNEDIGLRVSVHRLSEFLEGGRDRIGELRAHLFQVHRRMEADSRSLSTMVDGLLEGAKEISMTPFSVLFDPLPGAVRSLLSEQQKEAELSISGSSVEADRRVLEEMKDPLTHLIRNCIDHGIERPEERTLKGKPRAGRIEVSASQRESGKVELVVADNGGGIDIGRVRASALRAGLISDEDAGRLDEERLRSLVFRSGVSTSPLITDMSGRGLGLAIVHEKAEKLGGSVSVESSAEGTLFRILLPVTLATVRGLLVRAREHLFVIPAAQVRRTVRVAPAEIRSIEGKETISIDGAVFPLIPLAGVLELPASASGQQPDFVYAAVLESEEKAIAFAIDEVLHEQEFLVKGLGRQLKRVRNVAGAAAAGAGRIVPVLNVSDLVTSAVTRGEATPSAVLPSSETRSQRSLLVVEDSVTARSLLKSILEAVGYGVRTAVDGLEAYGLLREEHFDLVISDVDMPRMNGFELTAKIRADKALVDLPVVLVTALDSRADRERGIDVGANAYIVKSSFDQSNLLEVIKRLV